MRKYKWSFVMMVALWAIIATCRFNKPVWNVKSDLAILSWDVFGYYLYLPATFIYSDLGLENREWADSLIEEYKNTATFYQAYEGYEGKWVIRYSLGWAVLNLPFFTFGHLAANLLDYPMDGLSPPYQFSIMLGALLYTLLGLLLLRTLLIRYFSDWISALVLGLMVLATNYFQLTAYNGAMQHNYLFLIFGAIIYYTIRWHEAPTRKYAMAIGLLAGLAIITRPSSMVILLVPMLWNVYSKPTLMAKFRLIGQKPYNVIWLIACLITTVIPQLIYWKYTTGGFFHYSYGEEGFDFLNPYISEVLFSYKKGWLVYTPFMIFPIVGFWFFRKYKKQIFPALFLFFIANLYFISSWETWWYGGSFSQRSFMESYVVMAFPLGYLLQWIASRNITVKLITTSCFMFLLFLNQFQIWQYMNWIISNETMTKDYYWAVFLKASASGEDRKLLEIKRPAIFDNEADYTYRFMETINFEGRNTGWHDQNIYTKITNSGHKSYWVDTNHRFSPIVSYEFQELTDRDHVWVRATVNVYPTTEVAEKTSYLVVSMEHDDDSYRYHPVDISSQKIELNEWNTITTDFLTPFIKRRSDVLKVYFWLKGDQPVLIDDLKVEIFEPK